MSEIENQKGKESMPIMYIAITCNTRYMISFNFFPADIIKTRPKPVELDYMYVFSMAVGIIGEWLKLVPFFVRGRTVDSERGGGAGIFF